MMISFSIQRLQQTRWYEYAIRFILGGLVTAGAGQISKSIGASFGGLFLAFPALLAASLTLVAKHAREKQEKLGQNGQRRAKQSAGADAAGAVMGSVGLFCFALTVWKLVERHQPILVIGAATIIWAAVCGCIWLVWKLHPIRRLTR